MGLAQWIKVPAAKPDNLKCHAESVTQWKRTNSQLSADLHTHTQTLNTDTHIQIYTIETDTPRFTLRQIHTNT